MYKCKKCSRVFEAYCTVTEDSGEKWYVCPYCKDTDFKEVRAMDDEFFFVAKSEVIDDLVSALSAINEGDIPAAKEMLAEFICDLVGESLFKYREVLDTVKDGNKSELIGELCTLLEVVCL